DADSARVQNSEVVLAVRDAVIGGFAKPHGCGAVVRLAVDAFSVEDRKVMHGLGVAGLGGGEVVASGGVEGLLGSGALLVKAPQSELRRRDTLFGGSFKPLHRCCQILRHAAAL